ncbi:MAG: AraC family transcriptional regulator [Myxococcaceae bacterium]|nr:AraC family transcriptional regulator [Myxococcaceae bacterium]
MAISVVFARALLDEVRERGAEPEQLLRDCEIEPERLVDLREMLSLKEANLLVETAMTATSEPALGLVIGTRAPLHMLQMVGHLMLAQTTLRHAFTVLTRYSTLLAQGVHWTLREVGPEAHFSFDFEARAGDGSRCAADYAMAMARRVGRHFLCSMGELTKAQFKHTAPPYLQLYSDIFQCPVLFDQNVNALTFPREYLDREQPHADSFVRAHLRYAADRLLAERKNAHGIVRRLKALLCQEEDLSKVTLRYVAPQLGTSVHTLRRSLADAGVTLSALLAETRCALARDYLRRPGVSVPETAVLLGFSERTAFDRAFRRWTGQTPAQFIKAQWSSVPSHLPDTQPEARSGRRPLAVSGQARKRALARSGELREDQRRVGAAEAE